MKRVYVLSQRTLFQKGIESLLTKGKGFEIVGQEVESSAAIEYIQALNPDVIMINLDDPEQDFSLSVLCILCERMGIKIVGLSLKENKISILKGVNKQIEQVDDLFNAILE